MLRRRNRVIALAACALLAIAVALVVGRGGGSAPATAGPNTSKTAMDPDAASSQTRYGDPVVAAEAYDAASRTYPANVIPPAITARAESTFDKIDTQTRDFERHGGLGHDNWQEYGPLTDALQPGVLAFSGADNTTASRITALLVSPRCGHDGCRAWAGAAGGGVWRSNNALASNPEWTYVSDDLAQNSVGTLTLDPTDPSGNTLYLGTGEGNRCTSGCESGVGLYKSTDAGNHWRPLPDACVGPTCVTLGKDAFLGRGINRVVVDPTNSKHIFVGSAQGVRGLSHVIGAGTGGQVRLEPGANPVGLYESTDGGNTFTMVWNGNDPNSLGVTDVELDPQNPAYLLTLGRYEQKYGDQQSGINALEQAARLAPDLAEIPYSMAVSYFIADDFAQASKSVEHALQLDGAGGRGFDVGGIGGGAAGGAAEIDRHVGAEGVSADAVGLGQSDVPQEAPGGCCVLRELKVPHGRSFPSR